MNGDIFFKSFLIAAILIGIIAFAGASMRPGTFSGGGGNWTQGGNNWNGGYSNGGNWNRGWGDDDHDDD